MLQVRQEIETSRKKRDAIIVRYWLKSICHEISWENGLNLIISEYTREHYYFASSPRTISASIISKNKLNIKVERKLKAAIGPAIHNGKHVVSVRIDSNSIKGLSWIGWRNYPKQNSWIGQWSIDDINAKRVFGRALKKGDIIHLGVEYNTKSYTIMINNEQNTQNSKPFATFYQTGYCHAMIECCSYPDSPCAGNEFTIV